MTKFHKIAVASVFLFCVTGCQKKEEVRAEPQMPATPPIPTLNASQLVDLSKNERQEIERRCLGVSHPTCTELKSKSFESLRDLKISLCRVDAAATGLSNRYEAAKQERKCDELF